MATNSLTAQDRCDRCAAQALLVYRHETSGAELLFCNHHGHEYGIQLELQGFIIVVDETEKLNIQRESSAA